MLGVRMNDRGWIEPIVERVVGQVLDSHAAQIRMEIVRRVMEEIAATPTVDLPSSEAAGIPPKVDALRAGADPAVLARAVAEIQSGTSQKEILRALLDTSSRYATRVALFVVKGSRATGWQARGFTNSDAIKDLVLAETTPAVVCAIRDRVLTSAAADDLDPSFLQLVGMPASGEGQVLPLILKDKVAALLYADSGTDTAGLLEVGSLQLLVLSTGAWLEVNALRKQAQKEPAIAAAGDNQRVAAAAEAHETAVHAVSPYNDPFASHPPVQARAAAASAASATPAVETTAISEHTQSAVDGTPSAAGAEMAAVTAEKRAAPVELSSAVAEVGPATTDPLTVGRVAFAQSAEEANQSSSAIAGLPPMSPEDQDAHRKAQRFARLLVDEIKLYNQAKVAEGRTNKDLYDRLKEVIEKSRVTYQKRYGSTAAASGNYFQHEIIRSLAEDDISIMGANFRH
jgi:hypothetical protein